MTEDLENLRLNTAIAELMKYLNAVENEPASKDTLTGFIRVLAPFAPFMAEELWSKAGGTGSVFHADWPKADSEALKAAVETIEIVVQEGGKRRGNLQLAPDTDDAAVRAGAVELLKEIGRDVAGLDPARIIVVRDKKTGWIKLVNIPKFE